MATATAPAPSSPHRLGEPAVATIEVVAVATDQEATLAASITRLHRSLTAALPVAAAWTITIADHGSRDHTWRVGAVLARDLPGVRVVRLPERLTRSQLRARWASCPASMVAFVTMQPDVDTDALVVPLARRLTTEAAGNGRGTFPPPVLLSLPARLLSVRAHR